MTTHDEAGSGAAPTVAGPQTEAAVVPPEAATAQVSGVPQPTVFSEEQRGLLVAVLDRIVPPNGALAGAGSLGVDQAIERTLAVAPALRRLLLDLLAEIVVTSARESAPVFSDLDAAAQERVLQTVEAAQPESFAALVGHAYRGYYVLPEVHAAIGYTTRPPQPLGHVLPPFREELLLLQRQRMPFWRPASPD